MVVGIERLRYLKVDFLGEIPPIASFTSILRNKVKSLQGELELAKCNLHVIEYTNQYTIIRCTHDHRDLVEAAIQLIKTENLIPCVRKVSGTLKALSKTAVDELNSEDSEENEFEKA